ncbi:sorbosone dehydrogenase family protein [Evansella sp. AB-rgal1]|uniref:PQQ-dependent sugar dehydrogenase n=1 Tax=Evansella sp. AB-rgal1 TaxID=3242696 RepID=UPI00359D2EC3
MKFRLIILLLIVCSACSNLIENDQNLNDGIFDEIDYHSFGDFQVSEIEVLATNLQIPWSIAISDEEIVLTEREGRIVVLNQHERTESEVVTSDPISHEGEGGLLGLALSHDFSESRELFLYYTYEEGGTLYNKVVKAAQDGDEWIETNVLLDKIPGDRIHNGGRLAIGPDDHLYVTTGDANIPDLSQDNSNLAGSILRMTLDGEIPDDNPFEDSYVFSYGHRNPQGLAWNENGILYSSEHGPSARDEINIIEAGMNYGWPVVSGSDREKGMESPLVHSDQDTWAPSGITVWNNRLFVTGLRGSSLYVLNEQEESLDVFLTGLGRIRDAVVHDGDLYFITNNTDGRGNPSETDDLLVKITLE